MLLTIIANNKIKSLQEDVCLLLLCLLRDTVVPVLSLSQDSVAFHAAFLYVLLRPLSVGTQSRTLTVHVFRCVAELVAHIREVGNRVL